MSDAYIFDAVRTPRGKGRPDGALHSLTPIDLGAQVLRALDARTGFSKADPEDVVFGCGDGVNDQGANIARSSVLLAGLPDSIPGSTVSRFCSSGLDAVNIAASKVMSGQADVMVAGGVEMMSIIPIAGTGGPNGSDAFFNNLSFNAPLGIAADLLATLRGHTREAVDAYAAESQARAARAWQEDRFAKSVCPVIDINDDVVLDRDEYMRPGTSAQDLAVLRPAFEAFGQKGGYEAIVRQRYPEVLNLSHIHTAGNSSGIVDGAAAMLIGTREAGEKLGLAPRAVIRSHASVAMDPCLMLASPVDATQRALARVGKTLADVDLFEVNEAFASVVLDFLARTGVSHERVNVNGGGVAMGHPIGATGVILVNTLIDEMERSGATSGLATLCVGLGMGVATYIERAEH
ncbi:acetyl-CoA C-acetyltransferase [Maritimibacter sp. DP07]|uniref:Acetyl-CoA C-acetyltransferase n=1 Tax=Maritimibacter harenae TaxID=2606218 RepID=A0A845M007_9RHOB|nr:acetyl-CoA C-acetyltransferase [Maritimibacter harenae]MZR11678.1 acetyl-CoA C-acetyltransferase [Maritimibacter harenae]